MLQGSGADLKSTCTASRARWWLSKERCENRPGQDSLERSMELY